MFLPLYYVALLVGRSFFPSGWTATFINWTNSCGEMSLEVDPGEYVDPTSKSFGSNTQSGSSASLNDEDFMSTVESLDLSSLFPCSRISSSEGGRNHVLDLSEVLDDSHCFLTCTTSVVFSMVASIC